MASASPNAICMVVEVVGARRFGQASSARGSTSAMSAALARALSAFRGDRDQGQAEALAVVDHVAKFGRLARPGKRQHGVAFRDHAEVAVAGLGGVQEEGGRPVDARVAAILRATCPLLPIPVTATRPLAAAITRTASSKTRPRPSSSAAAKRLKTVHFRG